MRAAPRSWRRDTIRAAPECSGAGYTMCFVGRLARPSEPIFLDLLEYDVAAMYQTIVDTISAVPRGSANA